MPIRCRRTYLYAGKGWYPAPASIVLMVKQLIGTQYLRVRFLLEALINTNNMAEVEEKKEIKKATKK